MCNKIPLKNFLFFSLLASNTLNADSFFTEHTLTISGAVAYTQFPKPGVQTLVFSNYVSDILLNNKQRHKASYNLDAKLQVNVPNPQINKITLGPALYWQESQYNGDIWELGLPEFFNYQARYGSKHSNIVLESDFYFKPISRVSPFFTIGAGLSIMDAYYDDYATSNIPVYSEKHWVKTQIKPVLEIGAGIALPATKHLALNVRYAYFYIDNVNIHTSPLVHLNSSNQNIFLGINYSL